METSIRWNFQEFNWNIFSVKIFCSSSVSEDGFDSGLKTPRETSFFNKESFQSNDQLSRVLVVYSAI